MQASRPMSGNQNCYDHCKERPVLITHQRLTMTHSRLGIMAYLHGAFSCAPGSGPD